MISFCLYIRINVIKYLALSVSFPMEKYFFSIISCIPKNYVLTTLYTCSSCLTIFINHFLTFSTIFSFCFCQKYNNQITYQKCFMLIAHKKRACIIHRSCFPFLHITLKFFFFKFYLQKAVNGDSMILNEPFFSFGHLMAGRRMHNCIVLIESIVGTFVLLCQIFTLVT
jgi:hypothetical protein